MSLQSETVLTTIPASENERLLVVLVQLIGNGSHIELRAEMDVLAVISNCPQINNPANDYNPTAIQLVITEH